jgi:hypothetical protein
MSSEESWQRLLALDKAQLRESIAACDRYLRSPEGIAEFGTPWLTGEAKTSGEPASPDGQGMQDAPAGAEALEPPKAFSRFSEELHPYKSLRDQVADLTRRVEKLEQAK